MTGNECFNKSNENMSWFNQLSIPGEYATRLILKVDLWFSAFSKLV